MYRVGQLLGEPNRRQHERRRTRAPQEARPSLFMMTPPKPTPLKNRTTDTLEELHIAKIRIRELEAEVAKLRRQNALLYKSNEDRRDLVRKMVGEQSHNKQKLQEVLERLDEERESPPQRKSPQQERSRPQERRSPQSISPKSPPPTASMPFTPKSPGELTPVNNSPPSRPNFSFDPDDFSTILDDIDAVLGKANGGEARSE